MSLAETIALVDDDRNILTSVSMALEAEGFQVVTYADGAEALNGFTRQPVDLAILDIKMPRMDGLELISRLRQKMESDLRSPRLIQTIRSEGYMFSAQVTRR